MNKTSVDEHRIHIKGLNGDVLADDIAGLVGRFQGCLVRDVYMSPSHGQSSWKKDFAVVRLECQYAIVVKIIKALDRSQWKGCRLHLNWAREWFRDKWQREKSSEHEMLQQKQSSNATNALIVVPSSTEDTLTVRRARGLRKLKVSTVPLVRFNGQHFCSEGSQLRSVLRDKSSKLRFASRTVFEAAEVASLCPVEPPAVLPPTSIPVAAQSAAQSSSGPRRGTGQRTGFGTLQSLQLRALPAASSACYECDAGGAAEDEEKAMGGHEEEEEDVSVQLVTDESLQVEQARIRDVLQALLQSSASPRDEGSQGGKGKRVEGKADDAHDDASAPAAPGPVCPEEGAAAAAAAVDMSQLQRIFQRGEGVWWGAQGDERAPKQDLIFLEAEKLGMEVRGAQTGPGPAAAGTETGAQPLFNFFGAAASAEEVEEAAAAAAQPGDGDQRQAFATVPSIAALARMFSRER
jgi:hypothetical protein